MLTNNAQVGDVTRTVRRIRAVMSLLIGLMLASLVGGLAIVGKMGVLSESLRAIQLDNLTWRAAQMNAEHKALMIAIQQRADF